MLSKDMLMNVVKFLPPEDLLKCAKNNRYIRDNDLYWKYLLKIRYVITTPTKTSNRFLNPFSKYHRMCKRELGVLLVVKNWLKDTSKTLNLSGLGLYRWPAQLKGKEHLVKTLNCSNNYFLSLPKLPECIKLVCISNNLLSLPILPKCEQIWCIQNKISIIQNYPECVDLDCSENPIKIISNLPKCELLYCYSSGGRKVSGKTRIILFKIPKLEFSSFQTKNVEPLNYTDYIYNVALRYPTSSS